MTKILKYSHPSASKYNVNAVYILEELQKELSLEMIKVMFTPLNFKFGDLDIKKKKTILSPIEE